jgi:predicted transposase
MVAARLSVPAADPARGAITAITAGGPAPAGQGGLPFRFLGVDTVIASSLTMWETGCVSTRAIALTLAPTAAQAAALGHLQRQFNRACDYISRQAWAAQGFNKVRLQRLVYAAVRAEFGLLAHHTIRAIAVVADSYKTDRTRCHTF